MKKVFQLLSLCTFAILSAFQSSAQNAEDIIAKNIENTGGKEKITSIRSFQMDLTINIMGQNAPAKAVTLVGKGLRVDIDLTGQKIVQVITDKGGWTVNPFSGITSAQAIPEQQFVESKDQLEFTPFVDYIAKGHRAELVGKEKMNNADVYKLNFTTKDNITTTYFFDAGNFYVLKTIKKASSMGQGMEVTTTFSDFRKTDYGVIVPFASTIDYGQFVMTTTANGIRFNDPVDASVFDMKKL